LLWDFRFSNQFIAAGILLPTDAAKSVEIIQVPGYRAFENFTANITIAAEAVQQGQSSPPRR